MAAGSRPVKQVEIVRDLNIAPATVNRIIATLSERGYILRTSEKYCIPNFRLSRNVPMSESYLQLLDELMRDITDTHRVSVEVVVVAGFDLLWHSRTELPDATVAIRARVGFRRNLYELDALARLYLARVGWQEISYKHFSGGFFDTGLDMKRLSAKKAQSIIESASNKTVDYDIDGNHLGVRRFATVIEDTDQNFLHLLSIAEAALPVRNRNKKISECSSILKDARAKLQAHINNEHPNCSNNELSQAHFG